MIKNRLKVYKESTAKVLGKYSKSIISRINGDNTPDEVFCDTLAAYVKFCKSACKCSKACAKKPAAKKASKKK